MSDDREPVQRYLDALAPRLHGPAAQVRRVLAETEAHLYEATEAAAASLASRHLYEQDPAAPTRQAEAHDHAQAEIQVQAQAEAVARFGSPEQVADAVNRAAWARARGPLLRAAATTAGGLAAAALTAMGVTGLLARAVAALTSTTAVYGFPAGARPPAASCRSWLALHPGAADCRQAATLEASSDLTLALTAAGLLGVILCVVLVLLRRRSAPAAVMLPPLLGPVLGTALFATAAAGCGVLAASNAVVLRTWGAGLFWTGAATCATASLISAVQLIRALPASYTGTPPAATTLPSR